MTNTQLPIGNDFMQEIKSNFAENLKSVNDLLNFDKLILDYCESHVSITNNNIKQFPNISRNAKFNLDTLVTTLKSIKTNDSLKKHYDSMYNQGLVLLVSYFTLAVTEIFRKSITYSIKNNLELACGDENIKLSFSEIQNLLMEKTGEIGDIVIDRKEISFQDLKSVRNAFFDFFGINIQVESKDLHNIILGLACRHVIVHNQARVSEKFMKQIAVASDRTLKKEIRENNIIIFNIEEIQELEKSMNVYIEGLIKQIQEKLFNRID